MPSSGNNIRSTLRASPSCINASVSWALAFGSPTQMRGVQAATRTNPWRWNDKKLFSADIGKPSARLERLLLAHREPRHQIRDHVNDDAVHHRRPRWNADERHAGQPA